MDKLDGLRASTLKSTKQRLKRSFRSSKVMCMAGRHTQIIHIETFNGLINNVDGYFLVMSVQDDVHLLFFLFPFPFFGKPKIILFSHVLACLVAHHQFQSLKSINQYYKRNIFTLF